jgi:hypothetical protein
MSYTSTPFISRAKSGPRFRDRHSFQTIPYREIAAASEPCILDIARNVAPGGVTRGREYIALNPTRQDRRLGSFRINFWTGCWADFATGDSGGDVISFVAYCLGRPNWQAAGLVAEFAGVRHLFDLGSRCHG